MLAALNSKKVQHTAARQSPSVVSRSRKWRSQLAPCHREGKNAADLNKQTNVATDTGIAQANKRRLCSWSSRTSRCRSPIVLINGTNGIHPTLIQNKQVNLWANSPAVEMAYKHQSEAAMRERGATLAPRQRFTPGFWPPTPSNPHKKRVGMLHRTTSENDGSEKKKTGESLTFSDRNTVQLMLKCFAYMMPLIGAFQSALSRSALPPSCWDDYVIHKRIFACFKSHIKQKGQFSIVL